MLKHRIPTCEPAFRVNSLCVRTHHGAASDCSRTVRVAFTAPAASSAKGRAAQKKRCRTVGREVVVRCLDDDDEILTYHSINDFKRAWPTVRIVTTKSFPKTIERDGRKYLAEVVEQPDLEGEVW